MLAPPKSAIALRWRKKMAELDGYMKEHAAVAVQDFRIWENKRYEPKPVLCDEDGPIAEHRRWAKQFYVDAASR